jgi:cytosine/adenosine deaminase-related metal-dependent hydrolase
MIDGFTRLSARHVWTPSGLKDDVTVVLDAEHRILSVERAAPGDHILDGLLLPGLVNAHGHLELSHHRRPVGARGLGSPGWVGALYGAVDQADAFTAERGARSARANGAAFFIDTSNSGTTAPAMATARLRGTVQVECIGLGAERWQPVLDGLGGLPTAPGVVLRPTAHAPISCSPELLGAALAPGAAPVTVHCDEDAADALLLADRTGPWRAFHERIAAMRPGHDWQTALGQARSGVDLLRRLGLLAPHVGLVHLTAATPADLDAVAAAGCTAVLCPRSNRHITGRLPDVPGMVARGIPLALGTDSRGSSPDLDLLAEAAVLRAAFPELPAETWLHAMTLGGARLLAVPEDAGRIAPGARPDLLHIDLPGGPGLLDRLLDGTRWPRRWLT